LPTPAPERKKKELTLERKKKEVASVEDEELVDIRVLVRLQFCF
jgi:hypothetical protein